jgi:hypothetical protein
MRGTTCNWAATFAQLAPTVRLEELLNEKRHPHHRHGKKATFIPERWLTDAFWRKPSLQRTLELLTNHDLVRFLCTEFFFVL